jgi:glycine oxidase
VTPRPIADVLVVGAGVMGCAAAFELARRGVRTTVLERSVPGAEASSAAAGMLAAQAEASHDGPFLRLCLASRARFGDWAAALREATGIDVEHRTCGVLRVAHDEPGAAALQGEVALQERAGLRAELLGAAAARAVEPAIAPGVLAAARFADDARVDPPSWLRALRIAAERAGATFRVGAVVRRLVVEGDEARGVETEEGERVQAAHVVLAAGSWSALVPGAALPSASVRPARGQIVQLLVPSPVLRGIVWGPRAYLCPRDDGRVLIGSTLEFVGFRRGVTAGAIAELTTAAIRDVPALADADFDRAWSSFRPWTADELPLIGASTVRGLTLATGHYRNGILLSPITAEIVAALATGRPPPLDVTPFSASRLTQA